MILNRPGKIDKGEYGICEETGEPIELEAENSLQGLLEAQEELERQEKKFLKPLKKGQIIPN